MERTPAAASHAGWVKLVRPVVYRRCRQLFALWPKFWPKSRRLWASYFSRWPFPLHRTLFHLIATGWQMRMREIGVKDRSWGALGLPGKYRLWFLLLFNSVTTCVTAIGMMFKRHLATRPIRCSMRPMGKSAPHGCIIAPSGTLDRVMFPWFDPGLTRRDCWTSVRGHFSIPGVGEFSKLASLLSRVVTVKCGRAVRLPVTWLLFSRPISFTDRPCRCRGGTGLSFSGAGCSALVILGGGVMATSLLSALTTTMHPWWVQGRRSLTFSSVCLMQSIATLSCDGGNAEGQRCSEVSTLAVCCCSVWSNDHDAQLVALTALGSGVARCRDVVSLINS